MPIHEMSMRGFVGVLYQFLLSSEGALSSKSAHAPIGRFLMKIFTLETGTGGYMSNLRNGHVLCHYFFWAPFRCR